MSDIRRIGTVELHAPTVWGTFINDNEDCVTVDVSGDCHYFEDPDWDFISSEYGWGVRVHLSSPWLVVPDPCEFIVSELQGYIELTMKQMQGVLDEKEREALERHIEKLTRYKAGDDTRENADCAGGIRQKGGPGTAQGGEDGPVVDTHIP